MKRLLLNFVIIFGSAYAFIQFVQFLPVSNTISTPQLSRTTSANSVATGKQSKANLQGQAKEEFNFKNNAVGNFLERSSSLNMMGYFDIQTLFYYPNLNFTSLDLFYKYPGVLKHDK